MNGHEGQAVTEAGQGGAAPSDAPAGDNPGLPAAIGEAVRAAVHVEFDAVLNYVVEALRRNNAFDELNDRLRIAERRLETRRERPLIAGVYQLLDRLRHFEFDHAIRQALEDDIVKLLNDAGFEEIDDIDGVYDPARHEAIGGRAVDGQAAVTKVHTRGLASFGDVVFRARVEISPKPDHTDSRLSVTDSRESPAGSAQ